MKSLVERKARTEALLDAFTVLHNHIMQTTDMEVVEALEKAQKEITSLI